MLLLLLHHWIGRGPHVVMRRVRVHVRSMVVREISGDTLLLLPVMGRLSMMLELLLLLLPRNWL